jgi:hypothetical protein
VCREQCALSPGDGRIVVECVRCGHFTVTGTAQSILAAAPIDWPQNGAASAWLRENQGAVIGSRDLDFLSTVRPPSVHDRAMKLLAGIAREWPMVGMRFEFAFPSGIDMKWVAISWSADTGEVEYLAIDYLHEELEALDGTIVETMHGSPRSLLNAVITPHGHRLLEQLRSGNPESQIGFCAMWFAEDVADLWWKGIEPAIRAAGYEPVRIDQHEHVNRIDEEIIAMIRQSKFVVADFTGQRGGVYFEAGFALGLNLRVIWTCREDELQEKKIHFDTRQYNFLSWRPGEWDDFARRLQIRIEATLGKGPARQTDS